MKRCADWSDFHGRNSAERQRKQAVDAIFHSLELEERKPDQIRTRAFKIKYEHKSTKTRIPARVPAFGNLKSDFIRPHPVPLPQGGEGTLPASTFIQGDGFQTATPSPSEGRGPWIERDLADAFSSCDYPVAETIQSCIHTAAALPWAHGIVLNAPTTANHADSHRCTIVGMGPGPWVLFAF